MSATDLTADCTVELVQGATHSKKELFVTTPATADTDDTLDIDLTKYACTKLEYIEGCVHTTVNSVLEAEEPTTAVSSDVLTITVGGTAVTGKKRTYNVFISA
jgi:hypothetical protein